MSIAISMGSAKSTLTADNDAVEIVDGIRNGEWAGLVGSIRHEFNRVLTETGDLKAAKNAIQQRKLNLPAVTFSGTFSERRTNAWKRHSGLLCADLDNLGERLGDTRTKLLTSPHLWALFLSPTGNGLKAVFRVPTIMERHTQSFRAIRAHVKEISGEEIDQACKDAARLCFVSYDPDAFLNTDASELEVLEEPTPKLKGKELVPDLNSGQSRQSIAAGLFGAIDWKSDIEGFCQCPGEHLHTTGKGKRDCRVSLDGVPTVSCFHATCSGLLAGVNHELRSRIGKLEFVPSSKRNHAGEYLPDAESIETPVPTLAQRLEERLFNVSKKPAEAVPRFWINGVPCCTPGNLTAISAPPKTAKTSFLGAMTGAAMTNDPDRADCLGVSSNNPQGLAIIHFDTEQSPADHYAQNERAFRRAWLSEPPAWLRSYCLTGFSVPDLRQALAFTMEENAAKYGGIHSVILDGSADMVNNVNDPEESNLFVSELHAAAIKYACPIIGVIHLNPGTEKTRGHLGSQLERKAETNLKLEFDGEAVVVWSDKSRGAPISKNHGPRFAWSDDRMMFVSVQSLGEMKAEKELPILRDEAQRMFKKAGKSNLGYNEMGTYLAQVLKITEGGARKRVDKMRGTRIVIKQLTGDYSLTQ